MDDIVVGNLVECMLRYLHRRSLEFGHQDLIANGVKDDEVAPFV